MRDRPERRGGPGPYTFTVRAPIVAAWGSERWDVWEGERLVGAVWDWRLGWAGEQRWTVAATDRSGARLFGSRGVALTSRADAVAWLRAWWAESRRVSRPAGPPAPSGATDRRTGALGGVGTAAGR